MLKKPQQAFVILTKLDKFSAFSKVSTQHNKTIAKGNRPTNTFYFAIFGFPRPDLGLVFAFKFTFTSKPALALVIIYTELDI